MLALISLLMIILTSITIVRIGATALELTGLSTEVASFQAQSAFSGVGFTTSETESIVNHPVRRKIVRILILFGSAGVTTTIAAVILTFVGQSQVAIAYRGMYLIGGLFIIYLFARSKIIHDLMKRIITKALSKSMDLKLYDYQEILGISRGYGIAKMLVKTNNWVVGKHLKDLHLNKEGIIVLALHRIIDEDEKFMIPTGETVIQKGDSLTLYGRTEGCKCLAEREAGKKGDADHKECCDIEAKLADLREKREEIVEV